MLPNSSVRHYGPLSLLVAVLWGVGAVSAQGPQAAPAIRWPFEVSGEGGQREERERPERDEIETDRDSFTPAVTTVRKGRFIFESAYSFLDNRERKETHSLPEALLRYGLTERLELRLGTNYEVGGAGNDVSGSGSAGEDEVARSGLERATSISYGLKYRVTRQDGWVPGSSVILQGYTPTSGPETATRFTGTYVFGWDLAERWKLDAAMRYRNDGELADNFNTWSPSLVLKAPVGERISVHAEYFGLFSQGKQNDFVKHYFSPGVHYLLTDDVEVGVRVGWGLNDQSARFFANVGFGLRF